MCLSAKYFGCVSSNQVNKESGTASQQCCFRRSIALFPRVGSHVFDKNRISSCSLYFYKAEIIYKVETVIRYFMCRNEQLCLDVESIAVKLYAKTKRKAFALLFNLYSIGDIYSLGNDYPIGEITV